MAQRAGIGRHGVVAVAASVLIAASARAQQPGDVVRVRVAPPAGDRAPRTEWIGALERLDVDSVVLRGGEGRRAFARGAVQRVWVRRQVRPAHTGALRWGLRAAALGAAAGAVIGAAGIGEEACTGAPGGGCDGGRENHVGAAAALVGIGFGAGGAVLGATYGRYGWRDAELGLGATLQVTPTRVVVSIPLR